MSRVPAPFRRERCVHSSWIRRQVSAAGPLCSRCAEHRMTFRETFFKHEALFDHKQNSVYQQESSPCYFDFLRDEHYGRKHDPERVTDRSAIRGSDIWAQRSRDIYPCEITRWLKLSGVKSAANLHGVVLVYTEEPARQAKIGRLPKSNYGGRSVKEARKFCTARSRP